MTTKRKTAPPDPRHKEFRLCLETYWAGEGNTIVPVLPWGAAEAGALAAFLRANPTLGKDGFMQLLQNRLDSDDHACGESPKLWLGALTRYAQGALDRFKLPKARSRAEAVIGIDRGSAEVDDRTAMLNYWREIRSRNPSKFAALAPGEVKLALAAE